MNVFIVEDSNIILKKLKRMLASIDGIKFVGHARNIPDAIRSIVELKPDVVILDIRLDDGNGIDVLEQIKKENPPPIVIIFTNYPYPQYREKCKTLGADYFFDKVKDVEKLYKTFVRLMKDKP
jgi:DNA-binding NarL/FixJ family response regulator